MKNKNNYIIINFRGRDKSPISAQSLTQNMQSPRKKQHNAKDFLFFGIPTIREQKKTNKSSSPLKSSFQRLDTIEQT